MTLRNHKIQSHNFNLIWIWVAQVQMLWCKTRVIYLATIIVWLIHLICKMICNMNKFQRSNTHFIMVIMGRLDYLLAKCIIRVIFLLNIRLVLLIINIRCLININLWVSRQDINNSSMVLKWWWDQMGNRCKCKWTKVCFNINSSSSCH